MVDTQAHCKLSRPTSGGRTARAEAAWDGRAVWDPVGCRLEVETAVARRRASAGRATLNAAWPVARLVAPAHAPPSPVASGGGKVEPGWNTNNNHAILVRRDEGTLQPPSGQQNGLHTHTHTRCYVVSTRRERGSPRGGHWGLGAPPTAPNGRNGRCCFVSIFLKAGSWHSALGTELVAAADGPAWATTVSMTRSTGSLPRLRPLRARPHL